MLFKGSVCGIKWHSEVKNHMQSPRNLLLEQEKLKSKGDMKVQKLSQVQCSGFQRRNEGWGRFKSKR